MLWLRKSVFSVSLFKSSFRAIMSDNISKSSTSKPQYESMEYFLKPLRCIKPVGNVRNDGTVSLLKPEKSTRKKLFNNKINYISQDKIIYTSKHISAKIMNVYEHSGDDENNTKQAMKYSSVQELDYKKHLRTDDSVQFSVPDSTNQIENGTEQNECENAYFSRNMECLQEIDLAKILKFNALSNFIKPDEADMILDSRLIDGQKYFFVKWKDKPMKFNSWEPECRLIGHKDMLEYYEILKNSEASLNKQHVEYFLHDITTREPPDILTLTKLGALLSKCSQEYVDSLKLTAKQLKEKAKEIESYSPTKLTKMNEKLRKILLLFEARKLVLARLKEWEKDINIHSSTYIEVENNVDLGLPPSEFDFIHDYINYDADIPPEPVTFCQCDNCFQNKNSCCPLNSDGQFAYNKQGLLVLPVGSPIYECNKLCACGSECVNRVVQHGCKIKVAIFKTSYDCGWGLKTLENIKKGQFVLEYLGEIITSEAAEERAVMFNYTERSYLFDLDYGMEICTFTVDSTHKGNAARFINHSCDPNLYVAAVWINQPDPRQPRLSFFAKRRIKHGEELTFDYQMVRKCDRMGKQSTEDRILCKCNSINCRKYLF